MTKLHFNVVGPCVPGEHYILDPLRGIGDDLMNLIDSTLNWNVQYSMENTHKDFTVPRYLKDDKIDTEKPWDEKIYMEKEVTAGKKITVVGC